MQSLSSIDAISYTTFDAKKNKEKITSLTFWLHLTDNCNLTCSYCYISTLDTRKTIQAKTIEQFAIKLIEVVEKYPQINKITIKLAGGEPLVNFNIWKNNIQALINQLKKNLDIKLNIRILSNLTVLTDEIIQYSLKNEIVFGISIDGLGEYHNKYRKFSSGKGSFLKLEQNLLRLKDSDIPVAALITIANNNVNGILDLVKFLLSKNITFRLADAKGDFIDKDSLKQVLHECYDLIENYIYNDFSIEYQHVLCDLNIISP